jgi:hypothetical protein
MVPMVRAENDDTEKERAMSPTEPTSPTLKLCPNGHEVDSNECPYPTTRDGDNWTIHCAFDCDGCAWEVNLPTREEAIAAWNLRTPAPIATPDLPSDIAQLLKFYSVSTLEELARIQSIHIGRLQAKLPPLRDEQPRNYREG